MRALRFWRGTGPELPPLPVEPAGEVLTLWIHLGERSAGLLPPLLAAIEGLTELSVRPVVTGTPRPLDPEPRLPLPAADDVAGFLAAKRVAATIWAAPPLDATRLDAALARPVVVLPFPDPAGAVRGGPVRRRAAGDALSRCTVMAATIADARALRRVTRTPLAIATTGPPQDGVAVPAHDEARRIRISAALAGRPVWFAVAVPPGLAPDILDAHAALTARVHRALLVLDCADGAPSGQSGLPDARESVVRIGAQDERGLWYRIAPVTLMADTFGGDGSADPLEAAALGSAVLHGPAFGARAGTYERLARARAAQCLPDLGAIAATVEEFFLPENAARQAGAAWAEVTRGAEATDRAAAAVVEALERIGAL